MAMIYDRIAIIGIGLIGASIARAAREFGAANTIQLYDANPDVRARARELDLGEVIDDPEEAVAKAELVVLCVPVGAMAEAVTACKQGLKIGAIVTDVGSVKQAVVSALTELLPTYVYFVPGHPLAGTEHSGPDAGFASLFHNRWQILTPLPGDEREGYGAAVDQVEEFWRALGANVDRMDPERHDVVLAVVSHLPHLIAFNIVAMAEDLESVTESEVVKYSASGFRDFTRIAASDPTMWRDVFLNNREAVLEVLGRFSEDLAALQRAIRWGEGDTLYDLFDRARRMRREVIEAGQDTPAPNWGREN
ncbi:prephenate/arogenate dehydrogenase family protein [Terricaulis silvestris]|uniref:prephenate dehydrogenase n=1 Tax=Terricaulis silvestris TaxID=2686094 RepID=A0A6I6MY01_9CAUL|nr:prephenate/arogenate dehydrogenase family protein [Terricaulis silvestris]QGZ96053.1 Arogenate dehydrogenase [Terricaulis silvestris]